MKKKWNELYNNEEELIHDMLLTNTDNSKDVWKCVKDYLYIQSVKEYYYLHDNTLPTDVIIKLKHMAWDIYSNVHYVKDLKERTNTFFVPIMNVSDYIKSDKESEG